MAKLKMDEAKGFKSIMKTMSSILKEADFRLGPDGLKVKSMDQSCVTLVDLELSPGAFRSYEVPEPETFALDVAEASKVLPRAKSSDALKLEVNGGKERLKVAIRGDATRRFELPLMDPIKEESPELNLNLTAEAELLAGTLKGALRDAKIVSDNVDIGFAKDHFTVSAESEVQTFDMNLPKEKADRLDAESEVKNRYAINRLMDTLGAAGASETVELRTGNDLPIVVETNLADGGGRLVCYLAPRVEVE